MRSIAYIAKLKPGTAERAAELIAQGPPFDPSTLGFERHSVYLGSDHAVFVFTGGNVGLLVETVASQGGPALLGAWEVILDGLPGVAHEVYVWERDEEQLP